MADLVPATGLDLHFLSPWERCNRLPLMQICTCRQTRRILPAGNRTRFAFSFPLGKMQSPSPHANLHLSANPEDTPCRQPDSICIFFPFRERKLWSCRHRAGGKQMPTGHLHLMGSSPVSLTSKKHPVRGAFLLVPATGLEPVRFLRRGILSYFSYLEPSGTN